MVLTLMGRQRYRRFRSGVYEKRKPMNGFRADSLAAALHNRREEEIFT